MRLGSWWFIAGIRTTDCPTSSLSIDWPSGFGDRSLLLASTQWGFKSTRDISIRSGRNHDSDYIHWLTGQQYESVGILYSVFAILIHQASELRKKWQTERIHLKETWAAPITMRGKDQSTRTINCLVCQWPVCLCLCLSISLIVLRQAIPSHCCVPGSWDCSGASRGGLVVWWVGQEMRQDQWNDPV